MLFMNSEFAFTAKNTFFPTSKYTKYSSVIKNGFYLVNPNSFFTKPHFASSSEISQLENPQLKQARKIIKEAAK